MMCSIQSTRNGDVTADLETEQNMTWVRNPHFEFIRCNDNEIFAKHGRRSLFSEIVRDDAHNGVLADVIDYLSQERLLGDLERTFANVGKNDLAELLSWLADRGIVVNGPAPQSRIDTYLRATGTPAPLSLENVSVGIVGGGAVGLRLARCCADFGIGRIRQLSGVTLASADDARVVRFAVPPDSTPINSAKALQEHVLETGFRGEYYAISGDENDASQIRSVFEDVDLGIVALDSFSPDSLHTTNEIAIDMERTWLFVYVDGSELSMGPVFVPGETPCYLELAIQEDAGMQWRGQSWLYNERKNEPVSEPDSCARPVPSALSTMIPCHADVAAGIVSREVLRLLTTTRSSLQSRNLRISFEDLEFVYSNVMALPRCPACSASRAPYRSTFF